MMDKKQKILIIDDEEDFCHFVKLNLERSGRFDVLVATRAQAGIDLAKINQPDLILLDILMPDMDGSQVAENLLLEPTTAKIPIVFLTALAQKKEVASAEGVIGGRTFIAKPVSPQELIARIEIVLGK
jgi:DNA-binding response OmpR family regulator